MKGAGGETEGPSTLARWVRYPYRQSMSTLDASRARPAVFATLDRHGLDRLVEALRSSGHEVVGPVVRDGAIVFGEIAGVADLPEGWHDTQAPGSYRLEQGSDPSLFGWAVGPHSLKAEAFPSRSVVWRAVSHGDEIVLSEESGPPAATAVFGARPCELAALEVLDRVLEGGSTPDPSYRRRRPRFVIVAECGCPSSSCFCTSMGTGPDAHGSFDLALTEIVDEEGQRFLVRAGSSAGAEMLTKLGPPEASEEDVDRRERLLAGAAAAITRRLETDGLRELLARNIEHPRWAEVAERCLSCGNCTLVCPTCFCANVADSTDIFGSITRERTWASCFEVDHSYLHGGPIRPDVRSRYRQWMTHKLSSWWDQFGTSGCVGCGRCITWCPVGIDLTEEAAAIRETDGQVTATQSGTRKGAET